MADSVSFVGAIPHESEDLPQLYQVAHVFVIPSAVESQSIVTLEAMASGLPLVVANGGALGELVAPDENGFLFTPGNSGELARYVVRLLKDPGLARRLGRESLLKAGLHRIEVVHQHVVEVYRALQPQPTA